jgi:tRNA(His) guanylyltransferase
MLTSRYRRLTTKYNFVKPNDRRALDLMNDAAEAVMKDLPDLVLAYGQSDEFRYVFLSFIHLLDGD